MSYLVNPYMVSSSGDPNVTWDFSITGGYSQSAGTLTRSSSPGAWQTFATGGSAVASSTDQTLTFTDVTSGATNSQWYYGLTTVDGSGYPNGITSADWDQNSVYYAWYTAGGGTNTSIYVNSSAVSNSMAVTSSSVLKIEIASGIIKWYLDGVEKHSLTAVADDYTPCALNKAGTGDTVHATWTGA
jgi:hypothetical protein